MHIGKLGCVRDASKMRKRDRVVQRFVSTRVEPSRPLPQKVDAQQAFKQYRPASAACHRMVRHDQRAQCRRRLHAIHLYQNLFVMRALAMRRKDPAATLS